MPTLLSALDRYPYGCAEQTVSAAPCRWSTSTRRGQARHRAGQGSSRRACRGAIARVFEMQDSSGAFGVWGPSDGDMWLTGYVTDFLTRAKERATTCRPQAFNQALDRLQNFIAYAQDFEKGGEDRAYALYVLARNGRAPIGELRYYADTARPLLDAAGQGPARRRAGHDGRQGRAPSVRSSALDASACRRRRPTLGYRSDYGSDLRDGAALITLARRRGIANVEAAEARSNVIAKAYVGRSYTSTQEQAWMLLAAQALWPRRSRAMNADRSTARRSSGAVIRAVCRPQELEGWRADRSPTTATPGRCRGYRSSARR